MRCEEVLICRVRIGEALEALEEVREVGTVRGIGVGRHKIARGFRNWNGRWPTVTVWHCVRSGEFV